MSSTEQPERFRILLICLFAWMVTNMDQSLFGYAVPGILAEFHLGLNQVGYILSLSFLFAAFVVVFAGLAADRFGRRWTLAALLACSALFIGLHATAASIGSLTNLRMLAFGLSAGLAPITSAYVVESAPARHRGFWMGVLQCGYPLGWFVAALIAAPLLHTRGWRSIFLVGFAVIPVAFLIASLLPESRRFSAVAVARDSSRRRGLDFQLLRELFSARYRARSIASIILFVAFGSAYAGTAFYFPLYFMQERGYTQAEAAHLVGLSNGFAVIGYLAAAAVGEYLIARRDTYALWCVLGAVALLALLWVPTQRWQDLTLFVLTASFFYGSNAVVSTILTELYPTRMRTTAFAVCGSAPLSIGFAVFPSVVPIVVAAFGWKYALTVLIVPLLLLSAFAALTLPKMPSGSEISND